MKETAFKSDGNYQEFAKTPHFKLCNIAYLDFQDNECMVKHRDVCEGLAVERLCDSDEVNLCETEETDANKTYYVVCFIKFNLDEEDTELEVVGDRILDIPVDEFEEFKEITNLGIQKVNLENRWIKRY